MQHVLVVDDVPAICLMVQAVFEKAGAFRVSAAHNGQQALPLIDADPPDLLITDIVMPGMPGTELAAHADRRGIPLILMTGEPNVLRRLGPLPWPLLLKPFRSEQLLAQARAAMAAANGNGRAGPLGPIEPRLHEVLEEPIVRLLMKRDGVSIEDLHALIRRVQRGTRAPT